jgi:hypothetical protein
MRKSTLTGFAALLMMGAASLAFAAGSTSSSVEKTTDTGTTAASPSTGKSGASESEKASPAAKADGHPTGGSTATPQGREATMEPTPPTSGSGSSTDSSATDSKEKKQ